MMTVPSVPWCSMSTATHYLSTIVNETIGSDRRDFENEKFRRDVIIVCLKGIRLLSVITLRFITTLKLLVDDISILASSLFEDIFLSDPCIRLSDSRTTRNNEHAHHGPEGRRPNSYCAAP